MPRHGKNSSAGAVYTSHERKKDTKAGDYGIRQHRMGKDSVNNFDCCCLTLQPCRYPVVTLDGYLYDKEALLEYIIHQKKEIGRLTKEYEKQQRKDAERLSELAKAEKESQALKSLQLETSIISKPKPEAKSSISNTSNGRENLMPSFWIPSLTPQADNAKMKKPEKTVLCPMSGKPLKVKNLVPVKFTEVTDPDDKRALIARSVRYMCAVTHDILGNSVPSAVLRTSGSVVTMECVELIRKDMIDPTNGEKLKDQDIIPLRRGGTGFASTSEKLIVKVKTPAIRA